MFVASEYPDGWMVNFVLMMIEIGRFVVKVQTNKGNKDYSICVVCVVHHLSDT